MQHSARFPDLEGKSVFITGGGSGIGEYLTRGFCRQGARVTFVQRSGASALVSEIEKETGIRPLFIQCDITDIDALQKAIAGARAAHGPINVLVNNAASDNRHTLAEYSVKDWDASIAVNLRPHFFTAQAVAGDMRAAGGGSIINFSSIAYMVATKNLSAYAAAKAGIMGLTHALARDLGPDFIRVNALMPGWVLTKRQNELWATRESLAAFLAGQCLPEHLAPEDMVGPTLFLASNASRMMTGQALVVDGGFVFSG